MPAPLIGITTYRSVNEAGNPILALGENYVQAILQAGGTPILIPLGLPDEQISSLLSRLDGILFSGGGDVAPVLYEGSLSPEVNGVDDDRDRIEIRLIRTAVSTGLPFFGICRGLQVINVALGGTLYTHIANQHPQSIKHDYYPAWPRDHLPHTVQVESGSRLASILNTLEPAVNSLHHQGIRNLSSVLRASACAPDGLIEAIELPEHPFGLAVQWHPEWLMSHAPMRALFRSFVEAAS